MQFQNPTTPPDIARTLKKAGWKPEKGENWRSASGNLHVWATAIYLHNLGESNAPFVEVPDNKELRNKVKKPGLGNPAVKKPEPPKAKRPPHNSLPPEKVREVLRVAGQGISLTAVGKKTGVSRSTVSAILERNKRGAA